MKIEFTNKWENITEEHRATWKVAYPALNLDQELAKMQSWISANPKNRKSNWERFIMNWLSKAQDKAPKIGTSENGLAMIEKAKTMFIESQERMEERLKVKDVSEDEVRAQMDELYKSVDDFVFMMKKYHARSESVQKKSGFAYDKWVKWWRIGCEKWGKDTLLNIWKSKKIASESDRT